MKNFLILSTLFTLNNLLFSAEGNTDQKKKPIFPIFGQEAIERGYTLPNTYGINVIYVDMEQQVNINSLNLTGDIFLNKIPLGKLENLLTVKADKAKTVNTNELVRADMWVFPFLNVYGILGKTKGKSTAKVDIQVDKTPIKINDMDFTLKYEGLTYGAGAVLAAGHKNFFYLLDVNYTETSLDIIEGTISALVISPKIGYTFDFYNTKNYIWIGSMYQDITQTLKGDINDVFSLPEPFRVENGKFEVKESSASPWNSTVGFRSEINKNIEFTTEIGFGKRKSVTASLGYRF